MGWRERERERERRERLEAFATLHAFMYISSCCCSVARLELRDSRHAIVNCSLVLFLSPLLSLSHSSLSFSISPPFSLPLSLSFSLPLSLSFSLSLLFLPLRVEGRAPSGWLVSPNTDTTAAAAAPSGCKRLISVWLPSFLDLEGEKKRERESVCVEREREEEREDHLYP